MTTLMAILNSTRLLSSALSQEINRFARCLSVRSKDKLLLAGQICNNIYFVESGILRVYYSNYNKEITSSFSMAGQVCVSAESFFKQHNGIETIQAIRKSKVWFIDHEQYLYLCAKYSEFNDICRTFLENCQVARERRLQGMWMQPAQYRYKWLRENWPEVIERIPAKYVSSYLGFTPVCLSRLKTIRDQSTR